MAPIPTFNKSVFDLIKSVSSLTCFVANSNTETNSSSNAFPISIINIRISVTKRLYAARGVLSAISIAAPSSF